MDDYTKEQLEKTPIVKLKDIAKKYGVKGYTGINKTNKDEFVSRITEHISILKTVPQLTEKQIKSMDKKTLVEYATVLKVERVSLLNKSQLQEQILKYVSQPSKQVAKEDAPPSKKDVKPSSKAPKEKEEKKPVKKEEKIPSTKTELLEYLENKGIKHILSKNKTLQKLKEYALSERCDVEKDNLCSDDELICDIRNNTCLKEEDLPKRNYTIEKRGNKKIGGEPDKIPKKVSIKKEQEKEVDYSKLKLPELRKILLNRGVTTKYRGFDNKKDLINYIKSEPCDEKQPCTDQDKICDLRNNICVEEQVLPRREISKYENYAGTEPQIKQLIKLKQPKEEIIEEKKTVPEEVYLSEEDEQKNIAEIEPEEVYLSEEDEQKNIAEIEPEEVYLSEEDEQKNIAEMEPEEVYLSEEDEQKNIAEMEPEEDEKKILEEEDIPKFNVQEYAKSILLSTKEDDEYIDDVIEEIQESEDENLYSIKASIYKSLGLIR